MQFFLPKFSHKSLPQKGVNFQKLIKNFTENTLLIDEKIILQEASYKAQLASTEVKY